MFNTRSLIHKLHEHGFAVKRTCGGHARFTNGIVNIDVPIHKREQSPAVVASIRRAIRVAGSL